MSMASLRGSKKGVMKATLNRGLFHGADKTHCELKKWFFASQKHFAGLQIPIKVVYGFRSYELQDQLYRQGRTQKRGGQSPHNHGMALDIIHAERGWNLTENEWIEFAQVLLAVAERRDLKLRWGGDWNMNGVPVPDDPAERFWDAAHFELADWRSMVGEPCADGLCSGDCMAYWSMDFPAPI